MAGQLNEPKDVEGILKSSWGPCMALIYENFESSKDTESFLCTPYRFMNNIRSSSGLPESYDMTIKIHDQPQALCRSRRWRSTTSRRGTLLDKHLLPCTFQYVPHRESVAGPDSECIPAPFDTAKIPLEILETISQYLSRSDIKNMRLVDRRFEQGVSRIYFHTVVVPFNPRIYGKLSSPNFSDVQNVERRNDKGKGKCHEAVLARLLQSGTLLPVAGPLPQDLNIFEGFGPHIKRYAMALEVTEKELRKPPGKNKQQGHHAFWGHYQWPFPEYPRFADRAGLEDAADETATMKLAFSHLTQVKHLALALNAGLGWLCSEDLSIRSRVLQGLPHPFRPTNGSDDCNVLAQRHLWLTLEDAYKSVGEIDRLKRSEIVRMYSNVASTFLQPAAKNTQFPISRAFVARLPSLDSSGESTDEYHEHQLIAALAEGRTLEELVDHIPRSILEKYKGQEDFRSLTAQAKQVKPGVLFCRTIEPTRISGGALVPNALTQNQKEWLMETAWAQDAFLSSYMLSITDNSVAFQGVTTLALSPFSSRHLQKLHRNDFWRSLPGLERLDIKVIPDWRDVIRDEAGIFVTTPRSPSTAVSELYCLFRTTISRLESLKHISAGWAAGGEHAEGLHARNKHLLPAPISASGMAATGAAGGPDLIVLPHVKSLTLCNCWVTPNALEGWVKLHGRMSLSKITLESVSLTAHPRFRPGHHGYHAPQAIVVMANHVHGNPNHPLHQAGQFAALAGLNQNPTQQQQDQASGPDREGSWPDVFRRLRRSCKTKNDRPLELLLLSCGYARLRGADFDQAPLDRAASFENPNDPTAETESSEPSWLHHRRCATERMLLQTHDHLLGCLIPAVTAAEMNSLRMDWGLQMGWPSEGLLDGGYDDNDGWGHWGWRTAEGAQYDGQKRGGFGRFSGRIERINEVVAEEV